MPSGAGDQYQRSQPSDGARRKRLLDATVAVVARDGYSDAKVAEIARRAKISAATFYQEFANKESCFLWVQAQLGARFQREAEQAIAAARDGEEIQSLLAAVVGLAQRDPRLFSFLTHEAMLASPAAFRERGHLIARLADLAESRWKLLADDATIPDIPLTLLIGAAMRTVGFHLRRGEQPQPLLDQLLLWVDSYTAPAGRRRWPSVTPDPALLRPQSSTPPPTVASQPLPKGRHRLEPAVVERMQRERIEQATMEVVRLKGYSQMTVADIVATASISREVFYAHYRSKRDAFLTAYKDGFERVMVTAAQAFFTSSGVWPERVWQAGSAFAELFVVAPALANFGFVEAYALGAADSQRADDTLLSFTVFLEDGYRYRTEASAIPSISSEAIAGAIAEITMAYVRGDKTSDFPGLVGLVAYIVLSPFMGQTAANEFVGQKIQERSRTAGI